jgi:hypothetical protein
LRARLSCALVASKVGGLCYRAAFFSHPFYIGQSRELLSGYEFYVQSTTPNLATETAQGHAACRKSETHGVSQPKGRA